MSFTEEKRNQIRWYILEKIDRNQSNIAKTTAEVYGISLNTVYRYLKDLENEKIIRKMGREYKLIEKSEIIHLNRSKNELSEEDLIYAKYIKKYMVNLPDNVQQIWEYSFMEMMNNAIDHSESEEVTLAIFRDYMNTTIMIEDMGIGIFKKIMDFYQYSTLDDAVNELFKGKLTTDSTRHSGEGIFFTSRILDHFSAMSDGKIFTHNKYWEAKNNLEDLEFLNNWKDKKGTIIYMRLSNVSNKVLKEVFDMFSDADGSFAKTHIPVKNLFETYPVSRSQAKRMCRRFEKFKEIELDFEGINEIGQGFAHEVFVVFQNAHKDVKLIPMNTTEEVEKMIHHVKATIH